MERREQFACCDILITCMAPSSYISGASKVNGDCLQSTADIKLDQSNVSLALLHCLR